MTQSVVHAELASPVRRVWEVLTDLNIRIGAAI